MPYQNGCFALFPNEHQETFCRIKPQQALALRNHLYQPNASKTRYQLHFGMVLFINFRYPSRERTVVTMWQSR